ncbi:MAG: ABC transporter permease, partial [gamma proteobacterium endosymbiont of Lamellibrachia anaximandri]|nr:ABC transporter permease [gamma proteobacterium endosymbiont of Lamellibrachia anaximandri]
ASDRDGRGTNRLSKAESILGTGMSQNLSRGRRLTWFFTDLEIHSYAITLLVFVLTSILFALAGFINAVYANTFDDIAIVPTFVLTPLTYLGGVFYSIQLLPQFWQDVSMANPVLYMVNAFRFGLIGVSDIDLGIATAIILSFILALSAYSLNLLSRGVGIKK